MESNTEFISKMIENQCKKDDFSLLLLYNRMIGKKDERDDPNE